MNRNTPRFRLFAAAWVVVWMMAHTLCVQHCAGMAFAKPGGHDCCAGGKPGASKAPDSGGKTPCGGLRIAKLEAKAPMAEPVTVVAPVPLPHLAFALSEIPVSASSAGFLRAAPRPDFVFRPEVCLGAALRSLAPPRHA